MPTTATMPVGAVGADFVALTVPIDQWLDVNHASYVCRYLQPYKQTSNPKGVSAAEVARHHAKGRAVVPIGEGNAAEALNGAKLGARNGQWWMEQAYALGCPGGVPITVCCDTMPTSTQMPAVVDYFAAAFGTLGPYLRGIYAPSSVGHALIAAGVGYDVLTIPAARSWSPDVWQAYRNGEPMPLPVHLIQRGNQNADLDRLDALATFPAWLPSADPTPGPPRPTHPPHRVLRVGMRGEDVKTAQRAVGAKVDGWFWLQTRQYVRSYQRRNALPVTGVVGPQTWAVIDKAPT